MHRSLTRREFLRAVNVNIIMNIYVIKQPENTEGEKRIFLCTRVNYTKT